MRGLIVLAAALVVLVAPGAAQATDECRGLDVCISVPGPWVSVPAAPANAAQVVNWELTCPRRTIVGGLDAVVGDPALDVKFLGKMGSPINPGISTEQKVVFVATWARTRATTFRPLAGCIPVNGGGRRGTVCWTEDASAPVSVQQAKPPTRRVRTLRVRGSGGTLSAGCARGERLVDSSHAIGFRRNARPSTAMLTTATATRTPSGTRVTVTARRNGLPSNVRVEVQLHLLCARGPA